MNITIHGITPPAGSRVRVLVLRSDGTCVDEFGDIYRVTAADDGPAPRARWQENAPPGGTRIRKPWYSCSHCGSVGVPMFDYCPNCGADMRGDQDV